MDEEKTPGGDGAHAYEELGPLYDVWCAEVSEDIPFYRTLAASLAVELGRETLDVVELGGGSGRISLPLAVEGHHVTALDLAASQLALLDGRAGRMGLGDQVQTITADMRDLASLVEPASADLVIAPFRALLHVTPDRDDLFAEVARVLRPGGVFAFDVFHPTAEQVGTTHGRWLHRRDAPTRTGAWSFQERARYLPEAAAEPGGLKLEVDVRCRWRETRRGRSRMLHPLEDPAAGEPRERQTRLDLQLVPVERWAASITGAELSIDGAYGWFDARPLEEHDDDSIWVTRTAPDS